MHGLKVGHFTHETQGTGVSVFLFEVPAVGAYLVSGSAPASHELLPLEPEMSVPNLHAVVFTGGSAYGLHAAKGVMQFLTERQIGIKVPHGVVPIVPTVAIYDLLYKKAIAPTESDAYQACLLAQENNQASGRLGAGTGATVGKLLPEAKCMSGGLGYASITLPEGLQVMAYVVVNAVGDIRDHANQIVAGARLENGEFANCEHYLHSGLNEKWIFERANTTLAAVFTNAKLSTSELKRVCKMAIAGMARAISPVFTCYDGDIVFSISLGDNKASVLTVGALAAEAIRLAILDAVRESVVIEDSQR